MIPKKVYLRAKELESHFMCERVVSCDAAIGSCNVEYTDLSQLWHNHSVVPTERNKNIIYITTFDEIYIERIPRCLGGKLTDNSWNDFAKRECVIGWAYIDDLMPKNNKKMEVIDVVKGMLSSSIPKEKWTKCPMFRCVMNTGWAAGDDRYKCRMGKNCNSCGAINRNKKPIIVKL